MQIGRQSLIDQIVGEIRRRIVSGELPDGTPLRQEKLAAELGVSRVPLREAIRQLEAEGLVESEVHKGTVVSSLSPAEIEELFEIRSELETWLFGLAIPRMTESHFQAAEAVIAEASATSTIETWGDLNWRFHHALYAASERRIALRLLKTVHDNANRYVNLQLAVAADVEHELLDHRRLVAFARLGDVAGGVGLLRTHIGRVAENLLASIGRGRAVAGAA
ncbi:GntR family transcriptional regulator [Methylobacterium terricola]|uniref:GntR family transcriptional regulator n=1 Tax=Methylobacterium terricola TaxID=2583531 RepID=A0A5C4LA61_9HYPH|nr:GntR family transcriptional regulator [Methylobacterium terricola]TNC08329.1 GntR family transcriptional regulator [Methylobacterium terricola]